MHPHIRCILSTRCILTHLHSYAFTCIHDALHSRSVAFKCICMHSNIRCILWTRCILMHSHSYAFKRIHRALHSTWVAFKCIYMPPHIRCILSHVAFWRTRILTHSSAWRCIHSHTHSGRVQTSQGAGSAPRRACSLVYAFLRIRTHSYAFLRIQAY